MITIKSPLPSVQDITELLRFLPLLHAEGFKPVKRWGGGEKLEDGAITMPWPEYDEAVVDFFRLAGQAVWSDYKYRPEEAGKMLADHDVMRSAPIEQIRTMLTYCVRGERFCDGHWSAMIEQGHLRRLLERLDELSNNSNA
ncbi:MAG: DUF6508 domain-containing protein [Bacteroidota bacterium]